jgi:hypothetical protein
MKWMSRHNLKDLLLQSRGRRGREGAILTQKVAQPLFFKGIEVLAHGVMPS